MRDKSIVYRLTKSLQSASMDSKELRELKPAREGALQESSDTGMVCCGEDRALTKSMSSQGPETDGCASPLLS